MWCLFYLLTSWSLFTGLFFYLKKFIFGPKIFFFIFFTNFIKILQFIWDLGLVLFDSHKDVVSGKILVFVNILGFLGVNWAQKWPKSSTLGTSRFHLNTQFWKIVQRLSLSLRDAPQQTRVIFRGERAQKPLQKGLFHG